jgi:hypothetical protein
MNRESAVRALTTGRLIIGLGSWLTPRISGRMFGLDVPGNEQAPYLARLFGVRDAMLGIGLSQSPREQQRQWLQVGLACDVADAVAAIAGGKRGYLSAPVALYLGTAALSAAALGAIALQDAGGETA